MIQKGLITVQYHKYVEDARRERKLKVSPRTGYKSLTLPEEIYQELEKAMKQANEKAGYKKFRSLPQFVDYLYSQHKTRRKKEKSTAQ